MFIIKNKYYLYIDNTSNFNLELLKNIRKFIIIYRNTSIIEPYEIIKKFRLDCKKRKIKFYIANNLSLARKCKADGLYISSHNKKIYNNINCIGSAHNFREINHKVKQGCRVVILSRLFETIYKNKKGHYGVTKFNLISSKYKINIIPLGGINNSTLMSLKIIRSKGLAILSAVKKKPTKILSRLF